MKTAKFVNFSDEAFGHPSLGGKDELCKWNNEPYFFPPKSSMNMEDWKAEHFAKHLTNRELLKKKLDNETSPKFPEQHPLFMEMFNKAFILKDGEGKSPEKVQDELRNTIDVKEKKNDVFCKFCDSKGVRHKKDCPTLKKEATPESQFEGL